MSVYPRRDGIYAYDFQIQRVRFCGATGCRSRREADKVERTEREKAKQYLAKVREQRTGPMTVNVAFDRFWLEVGQTYGGSYGKTVWTALGWMADALGKNTLIRDIGPDKLTEIIAKRRGEGVKNGTVNRTVTELMRRILRRARDQWEQEVKPVKWGDLLLSEPKERTRELRSHEEDKLWSNMRADYLPALAFAVASGCRLKEVVSLVWDAIDWTEKTITIRGKGDKVATIPLTSEIIAIITPLRGHHPKAVFTYVCKATRRLRRLIRGQRYPITYSGLKTAWRRFGGAKAGLEDFRFHDTRHTAATRLLRETGNLKLVQKLLRHEEITTTAKYAHADDEDLRLAMEAVTESRKLHRRKTGTIE